MLLFRLGAHSGGVDGGRFAGALMMVSQNNFPCLDFCFKMCHYLRLLSFCHQQFPIRLVPLTAQGFVVGTRNGTILGGWWGFFPWSCWRCCWEEIREEFHVSWSFATSPGRAIIVSSWSSSSAVALSFSCYLRTLLIPAILLSSLSPSSSNAIQLTAIYVRSC